MAGAGVARVLSKCITVDWRAPAAAPGRAVLTSLHHVSVLFLRTGDAACELMVPRSFSRSLSDWIDGLDC
jgi:sarcosine oxidase subunit gamma